MMAGSANNSHEVVGIVTRASEGKLKNIDVRVVTAWCTVVVRFQERWVVVSALNFSSTSCWTVNPTAVLATVSNHSIPAYKTWAISCCEEEIEV